MGKMFKLMLYFLVFIVLLFAFAGLVFNKGMGEIKKMPISNVDLSSLKDGLYNGNFCKGRWCYEVSVQVASHRIISIRIDNTNMNGFKKLNNKLIAAVIREQKVPVDGVTNATITRKAFFKAVENALRSKQGN
jgi:uncharacterized protein with FMN-binding domain